MIQRNKMKTLGKFTGRSLWDWIKEHVRPNIQLSPPPHYNPMDDELSWGQRLDKLKDRIVVGFKIIFKF